MTDYETIEQTFKNIGLKVNHQTIKYILNSYHSCAIEDSRITLVDTATAIGLDIVKELKNKAPLTQLIDLILQGENIKIEKQSNYYYFTIPNSRGIHNFESIKDLLKALHNKGIINSTSIIKSPEKDACIKFCISEITFKIIQDLKTDCILNYT